MATPQPPRTTPQSVARQASRANPGSMGGRRVGLAPVAPSTPAGTPVVAGSIWIKIEAAADIVPMSNPYWSWDPDGTL